MNNETPKNILNADSLWQKTFDALPDLIAIIDDKHNILRVNKTMTSRLGLKSNECPSAKCYELVHGLKKPIANCPHDCTISDGKQHTAEIHEPRLKGDFLITTSPLFDENGKFFGCVHIAKDITEQKKTEENLLYLASFPQLNPNPIIEINSNLKILYINLSAEKNFPELKKIGRKHKALAGIKPTKEKTSLSREFECCGKTWLQNIIFLPSGDIRIYHTDITNRKQIEQAVKEKEKRLERAEKIAHLGSWELGVINNKLTWSDEVYRIFGLKPQQFGATYEVFLNFVHPDDRKAVDEAYSNSLAKRKNSYQIEHRVIRPTGEVRMVLEKCEHIRNEAGKIIRSIGMVYDITEQKILEQEREQLLKKLLMEKEKIDDLLQYIKLEKKKSHSSTTVEKIRKLSEFNQRIIDSAPVSIIAIDKHGYVNFVNDYFYKISDAKSLLGRKIFDISFFIRENLCDGYKKLLEDGTPLRKENCKTNNPKGEEEYINIIAVPLRDEKGDIDGAVSMAIDVTEAILAKNKLERMNEELENKVKERTHQLSKTNIKLSQSLELRSQFVSDASHELRTPLTIIKGNLHLATKEYQERKKQPPEIFEIINNEINKVSNILSDLTFLTSIDGASERIRVEDVNLAKLTESAVKQLKILAEEKNINLVYDKAENSLIIKGDGGKLERLISNLIRNAIKYGKNDGWVKIFVEPNLTNNAVKVIVSDNGIGIPEEDLPHIFDRFYRSELSRGTGEGGFGLGLSICKWIVEQHKGSISVESKVNMGSSFTVSLPIDFEKRGTDGAESKLF